MEFRDTSTDGSTLATPATSCGTPLLSGSGLLESDLSGYFEDGHSKQVLERRGTTLSQRVKNICCVGAGYVGKFGGPTATVIAFQNPHIRVAIVDKDVERVRKWNSKDLPIYEPGLTDIVCVARDGTEAETILVDKASGAKVELPARQPNLFFSTEVAKCISEADIVFLSVNTPTKRSGIGAGAATSLAAFESATRSIALAAKPGTIIVEKSTVPCRTAQMVRDTLEAHRPGVPFEVLSNPEFLAEGTAIRDLLNPDRVIIGSSRTSRGLEAAGVLKDVYSSWVNPSKIVTVNIWSSELAKLVANAMLAQRISSINTISAVCERTGADIDEVAHSVGLDQRLGSKFLKAGLGFGGSCFKKDILSLVYLARSLQLPEVGEYWMQVLAINEYQRNRFVKNVVSNLNGTLIGKKIAILGYAFKQGTNDTRESPAIDVVKSILADCPSEIAIFDPGCNPHDVEGEINSLATTPDTSLLKPEGPVEVYTNSYEACIDASAILILTAWDQFRYPPLIDKESVFHNPCNLAEIVDLRSFLKPDLSELDALTLRQYMRSERGMSNGQSTKATDLAIGTPNADPTCPEEPHKREEDQEEGKPCGNIEWDRIADHMKNPKWVFDGRGVVDVEEMEKLGFRVETIGKAGTRSRLND